MNGTDLGCPGREVLEGPPYFTLLLGLLDFFADPHGEEMRNEKEMRPVFIST